VDDELDDTIPVVRLSIVQPVSPVSPAQDFDDTLVRERQPPDLVEPELNPRFVEPSGVELTAEVPVGPPAQSNLSAHTLPGEPSPRYFRFRIGKTVVWLDVVCYVGRRPSSPRISYGPMPRLVRVASPAREVSSTHLEVRQLGASVVLTDMRSTNGSVIFPPAGGSRRLRQGESVVVTPGTLIDIGDGNVMEILPLDSSPREGTRSGTGRTNGEEGRQ
jgi:FHA domain